MPSMRAMQTSLRGQTCFFVSTETASIMPVPPDSHRHTVPTSSMNWASSSKFVSTK